MDKQAQHWNVFGLRVTRDVSIMDVGTLAVGAAMLVLIYADFKNTDKIHEDRITKLEQRDTQQQGEAREERNRIDQRLQNIEALLYKLLGKQEANEVRGGK